MCLADAQGKITMEAQTPPVKASWTCRAALAAAARMALSHRPLSHPLHDQGAEAHHRPWKLDLAKRRVGRNPALLL